MLALSDEALGVLLRAAERVPPAERHRRLQEIALRFESIAEESSPPRIPERRLGDK